MADYGNGLTALTGNSLFGIKHCGMLSFVSNTDGTEKLFCDWANSAEFSLTGETVDALGQGRSYVSWDTDKEGSATFNLQIANMDLLALSNGVEATESQHQFFNREVLTLGAGAPHTLTIAENAIKGTVKAFELLDDGVTKKTPIEALAIDDAGTSNKTVKLTNGTANKPVLVTYLSQKTGLNFTIKSLNENPENFTLYMRAQVKTKKEGKFAWAQLTFPNVMLTAENNFNFDATAPTDLTLNLRILPDKNGDMVKWALIPTPVAMAITSE